MAQDGVVITFDVDDGKLRQILTDPSGGTTTFGSWFDIYGVHGFEVQPQYLTKDLPGDGTILDIFSKMKKITGSFGCQMVFEVMKVLLGGATAYTGTTPSTKATLTISGTDLPNYFEFDFQSLYRGGADAIGGDFHINIKKAKMTSFKYSMASETYATLNISYEAVPRLSDGLFGLFVENETATQVAVGAGDTAAPTLTTVVPADAATGVATGATIVWTFNEAIQFNSGDFSLFLVASTTNITAAASTSTYNATTFVVTQTPTVAMTSAAKYVAVAAGVRDLAGNTLATPQKSNFTIA